MKKIIFPVIMLVFVSGCSSSWSTSNVENKNAKATHQRVVTDPKTIIVTRDDITNRQYVVLGDVNVTVNKTTIFNADPTPEMVDEKLRKEAAKLGANAVIMVRYGSVGIAFSSWGSLDANGRAVAFVK